MSAPKAADGGGGGGRRATRTRKVSERMAVVDEATRAQVAAARLDAFEADNDGGDAFGLLDGDDDDFVATAAADSDGGASPPHFAGIGTRPALRHAALSCRRCTCPDRPCLPLCPVPPPLSLTKHADLDIGGKRRKKTRSSGPGAAGAGGGGGGGKRRTRGGERAGPRSFARLLEESGLTASSEGPNYLTAAAAPSAVYAPRKLCSVCGVFCAYTCPRCGSRFCGRKCARVHAETRCLKFMA